MWRAGAGAGAGCIDLFNTQPVGVALSVKHNTLHWVPPLSTKRNAFSVSVSVSISPTPLSNSNNAVSTLKQRSQLSVLSSPPAPPFISLNKNPPPQLALLFLLFVLSTAIGAIFSLAIISIPTMMAFKKLGVSVDKLSEVVSEEVPGTLSSLKLSGLEINELTRQLTNLRQKISGTPFANKSRSNKPTSTHK